LWDSVDLQRMGASYQVLLTLCQDNLT